MVSKSVLTTFLSWVEHTEALGFTQQQINKLADEYLEVQGVFPAKSGNHKFYTESRSVGGSYQAQCECGYSTTNEDRLHAHRVAWSVEAPTVSTYCPPEKDIHTLRGDSIGMGVHERWYCSCGLVYHTRTAAETHRDFANASF